MTGGAVLKAASAGAARRLVQTVVIFVVLTMATTAALVGLALAAGDAVAVMGPSGSGKLTLLNLVAGLDKPTSGTVTVAGQRVDALSETRLARYRRTRVGMVFQFFNLLDDLTVADNVLLPAQSGRCGWSTATWTVTPGGEGGPAGPGARPGAGARP